jgi:hypothetical protein
MQGQHVLSWFGTEGEHGGSSQNGAGRPAGAVAGFRIRRADLLPGDRPDGPEGSFTDLRAAVKRVLRSI